MSESLGGELGESCPGHVKGCCDKSFEVTLDLADKSVAFDKNPTRQDSVEDNFHCIRSTEETPSQKEHWNMFGESDVLRDQKFEEDAVNHTVQVNDVSLNAAQCSCGKKSNLRLSQNTHIDFVKRKSQSQQIPPQNTTKNCFADTFEAPIGPPLNAVLENIHIGPLQQTSLSSHTCPKVFHDSENNPNCNGCGRGNLIDRERFSHETVISSNDCNILPRDSTQPEEKCRDWSPCKCHEMTRGSDPRRSGKDHEKESSVEHKLLYYHRRASTTGDAENHPDLGDQFRSNNRRVRSRCSRSHDPIPRPRPLSPDVFASKLCTSTCPSISPRYRLTKNISDQSDGIDRHLAHIVPQLIDDNHVDPTLESNGTHSAEKVIKRRTCVDYDVADEMCGYLVEDVESNRRGCAVDDVEYEGRSCSLADVESAMCGCLLSDKESKGRSRPLADVNSEMCSCVVTDEEYRGRSHQLSEVESVRHNNVISGCDEITQIFDHSPWLRHLRLETPAWARLAADDLYCLQNQSSMKADILAKQPDDVVGTVVIEYLNPPVVGNIVLRTPADLSPPVVGNIVLRTPADAAQSSTIV